MLSWSDRLYGPLSLPATARQLAMSCPLLLRLREIRMPNVPFLTFPSFAGTSRYEHSLGVAHLAWRWALLNGLPSDDAEALSLAGLYHDAATPAFSHLFEEFLGRRGFDHELEMARVLGGSSDLAGGDYAQVFLGRPARLKTVLQDRARPGERLSVAGIVRLSRGDDPLGKVLQGDLDLDNIDNVIRATTAMGLMRGQVIHPYEVATALVWEEGEVCLTPDGGPALGLWRSARHELYGAILGNHHEFLAQTAVKWAIDEYAEAHPEFLDLPMVWTLTEPELMFDHLLRHGDSAEILNRLRLGRTPQLLCSAWVSDLQPLLVAGERNVLSQLIKDLRTELGMALYLNFYLDKRERPVRLRKSAPRTLFPLDETPGTDPPDTRLPGGQSGVLGIVSLQKPAQSNESLLRIVADLVQQHLGAQPWDVSGGWVAARPPGPRQEVLQ